MSDRDFACPLGGIFLFIALAWLYWPKNVPCERLQSAGGRMIGHPWGCYVDLRKVAP